MSAYAISLHILERFFPTPVPWLRFGFANIVVLLVMLQYGFISALWVNIIRVIVASIIIGTFLGPGFILSFTGALVSLSAMGIAQAITSGFSPFGLSVIGAFFHSLTQLVIAQLLFVRNIKAIIFISPVVLIIALATGTINGFVVLQIIKKIAATRS